jgi:hypothetical protein
MDGASRACCLGGRESDYASLSHKHGAAVAIDRKATPKQYVVLKPEPEPEPEPEQEPEPHLRIEPEIYIEEMEEGIDKSIGQ